MREYTMLEGKRDLEPMGVVDIGSNSVRLVVYEGAVRSPTPIFNEKVLCGLGRGIASSGRLDEESVKRALEALTRFRAIVRLLEVKRVARRRWAPKSRFCQASRRPSSRPMAF
jgi:exopolyphosphatase/guanosine-5'-triphosphate,3'-diphosphate pyrophosphatase